MLGPYRADRPALSMRSEPAVTVRARTHWPSRPPVGAEPRPDSTMRGSPSEEDVVSRMLPNGMVRIGAVPRPQPYRSSHHRSPPLAVHTRAVAEAGGTPRDSQRSINVAEDVPKQARSQATSPQALAVRPARRGESRDHPDALGEVLRAAQVSRAGRKLMGPAELSPRRPPGTTARTQQAHMSGRPRLGRARH
jgi:hypothetical protein